MPHQALRNLKAIQKEDKAPSEMAFPALIERYKGEIARALPRHLNPDRMARIALTAFRMSPKLGECDPRSVFAAVIQASQLGLEVGLNGEAHLVPFRSKEGMQCQLIPGYTGLMKLARQSGAVVDIYAHEVRVNDRFSLKLGLERDLQHEPLTGPGGFPATDEERGDIAGFYAVAVFKDGSRTFVAMSRQEVERIRDDSRGYQMARQYKRESPWDTQFVAMGNKTAIRRLCNRYLPKSPELATALALDNLHEMGREQGLTVEAAVNGEFAPVIDADTGEVQEPHKPEQPQQAGQPANATGTGEREVKPDEAKPVAPGDSQSAIAQQAIVDMGAASSIEQLDEIYIRAEAQLEGAALETINRAYRQAKADLIL